MRIARSIFRNKNRPGTHLVSTLPRRLRQAALFLILLACFSAFSPLPPVRAQTLALAIVPPVASVALNGTNSVTLDVNVENVVDLYSYDVTFTYDPALLDLTAWAHGGFLTSLYQYRVVDTPGSLRLAFGQVGVPAVSGSGTLIRLTFSGLTSGSAAVTIANAVFSKPTGAKMYPTLRHGLINVIYNPTIILLSSLTGSISLQGQLGRAGIPVTLSRGIYVGQGPYDLRSKNLLANNLVSSLLPMDAYLITTGQERYLNVDASLNKVKGILSTPTVLSRLQLYAGDVAAPFGVIDLQDLALVGGSIGQGSGSAADVNFDGLVNARDLALVAGNYGLNSATAYAGWVP